MSSSDELYKNTYITHTTFEECINSLIFTDDIKKILLNAKWTNTWSCGDIHEYTYKYDKILFILTRRDEDSYSIVFGLDE